MKTIRTSEVTEHISRPVRLHGWVHALRRMGGINFLVLRDGYGTVQAVTEAESDLAALIEPGLTTGTVIYLSGVPVRSNQAPGGVELHQPSVEVLVPISAPAPLPLHKKKVSATLPTLLDHGVIANRHPRRRAVFKIAATAMHAFRSTLVEDRFTEIQSPKLVASATESGANVFEVDYFGQAAYLAQSPQFYKQIMVGVFERVFEVGPVFRAEHHNTSRHINQYTSLDVEFGFIDNHFTVMERVRSVLDAVLQTINMQCSAELALLGAKLPAVPAAIPHVHFADAKTITAEQSPAANREAADLSPEEERLLGRWAQAEFGSDFLFVTGYPMTKRPFYTFVDPQDPTYSYSFDLLFRGVELITGGQRLHTYAAYVTALQNAGLPLTPFESYLEAFRYGMPPHGGFAIGLERLLMQLLELPNIRLATLFPRDMNRLVP